MRQVARPVAFALAHHPAGLPAAHGARGRRGAHVPADGDHRRAGAGRRARVLADGVPGAGRLRAARARARRTTRARASSVALQRLYAPRAAADAGAPAGGAGRGGAGAAAARWRSGRTLGAEFVPRLDEGELSLDVKRLPSVSITEAQRLGVQVEEVLARFPEVRSVVTRTGRAEVATDPVGPDETEVMVKLRPRRSGPPRTTSTSLGEAIKAAVEREVPATFVSVSQPIEDRVNQLLAGSRADVVIKVFGDDLATLKRHRRRDRPRRARRARARRPARAARAGPAAARGDARPRRAWPATASAPTACWRWSRPRASGRYAGKIFEESRRFDLMLLLPPAHADAGGVRRAAGRHADRHAGAAGVGGDDPRDRGPGGHQPRVAAAARAGRGQRARARSGRASCTTRRRASRRR